jgi:hypothetical protein
MPYTFLRLILFCSILVIVSSESVQAQEDRPVTDNSNQESAPATARIKFQAIDTKILMALVDLGRFNIRFKQEANTRWPWRKILYPLAQEAVTACTLSNALVDLDQRANALNNPDLLSNSVRKRGLAAATVGSVIGGMSSGAELAQNTLVCHLAKNKGFSPEQSLITVKSKRLLIDEALLERQKMIDALPDGRSKELRQLESLLLMRARNQMLRQFKRWSARSRARMWRENTFYTLDTTQEALNLTSNILSYQAFTQSELSGHSAIVGLIAKSISTANPTVRNLAGKIINRYQSAKVGRELKELPVERADALVKKWGSEQELLSLAAQEGSSDRQIEQLSLLVESSEAIDKLIDKESAKIEKLQRVAAQQTLSGTAIGFLSLSQQIMGVIAFYGFRNDPLTSNRIRFASRIPQVAGQSYSLIKTPTTQALSILKERKLRRLGESESQELEKRLAELDKIEKKVKAW